MPAKSKKLHAPESTGDQFLNIEPDALLGLTERIESNLKNQGKRAMSKDAPTRSKTETSHIKKKDGEIAGKAPVSGLAAKAFGNGHTAIEKQKPTVARKRLRDGRVKEDVSGSKSDDVDTVMLETKNRQNGSSNEINVDEEVRALGGTKEDLNLITDVLSESEMEGKEAGSSTKSGTDIKKDLLRLVRQLGVDRVGMEGLMAGSESDDTDVAEVRIESQDPDMIRPNKGTVGVKPSTTSVGKGQNNLVSGQQCPFFGLVDIHAYYGFI